MPSTYFPPNEDAPTIAPLVGKRYYLRNGDRTSAMRHNGSYISAEVSDTRDDSHRTRSWELDGSHLFGEKQFDIIAEWVEPDTRPTIAPAAGKRYLMRNGEGVGPMRFRDSDTAYPWLGYVGTGVARTYTAQGVHHTDPQYDIVAEVTDTPTAEGPVRRLTKIVPGNYNKVVVEYAQNTRELRVYTNLFQPATATELRAAAATLSALAEALDEMGGAS
jgi:hypothetical protein